MQERRRSEEPVIGFAPLVEETLETWEYPWKQFREQAWEIHGQVKELFLEERTRNAFTMLPSIRHMTEMFGEYRDVLPREADIAFVEKSLYDRDWTPDEVHNAFTGIQTLAASFYPLVENVARIDEWYDSDKARDYAKDIVDRTIWQSWAPRGDTVNDWAESARRHVLSNVRYLWGHLDKDKKRESRLFTTSRDFDEERLHPEVAEQLMTNTVAVDPAHQRNSHVRTLTREVILDRLRNKPIADFFAHIEQLDESSAFVMLQFFGWLDTTRTEAYDTLPQMAYTGTLRRAVVKYMELDHIFGMEPAEPKQTIAQMVDSLTTYTVYKIGKMTLSPTSPRRIIAEAMGSGASVASDHLTERQQHILHLAAMHDHGQLTYTNDAIAAIIGINPRVVQTEIAVVAKLFGYTHYH